MKLRLCLALLSASAFGQEFVHGDECLFCHRNDIGPGWQKNAHGVAMRQKEDAPELMAWVKELPFGGEVTHTLGSRHVVRYLKQSGYGKADLLTARAERTAGGVRWSGLDQARWQAGKFGERCAGCHATAVDPATKAYSEIGIDCYTCHGVVDLQHSSDTSKIFLSKKRRSDAVAITNACAQCHLRGAKSRSTGQPWAAAFTVGDDLLKDLVVDWSRADDADLNPGDRHVWKNARDVLKNGGETSCISCHRVHANSSERHRRVLTSAICQECHNAIGPKKAVKSYAVHSTLCEY